jgi:hypothetical protein
MYINYTLKECTGATKYILKEIQIGLVYAFPYYPSTTAYGVPKVVQIIVCDSNGVQGTQLTI